MGILLISIYMVVSLLIAWCIWVEVQENDTVHISKLALPFVPGIFIIGIIAIGFVYTAKLIEGIFTRVIGLMQTIITHNRTKATGVA